MPTASSARLLSARIAGGPYSKAGGLASDDELGYGGKAPAASKSSGQSSAAGRLQHQAAPLGSLSGSTASMKSGSMGAWPRTPTLGPGSANSSQFSSTSSTSSKFNISKAQPLSTSSHTISSTIYRPKPPAATLGRIGAGISTTSTSSSTSWQSPRAASAPRSRHLDDVTGKAKPAYSSYLGSPGPAAVALEGGSSAAASTATLAGGLRSISTGRHRTVHTPQGSAPATPAASAAASASTGVSSMFRSSSFSTATDSSLFKAATSSISSSGSSGSPSAAVPGRARIVAGDAFGASPRSSQRHIVGSSPKGASSSGVAASAFDGAQSAPASTISTYSSLFQKTQELTAAASAAVSPKAQAAAAAVQGVMAGASSSSHSRSGSFNAAASFTSAFSHDRPSWQQQEQQQQPAAAPIDVPNSYSRSIPAAAFGPTQLADAVSAVSSMNSSGLIRTGSSSSNSSKQAVALSGEPAAATSYLVRLHQQRSVMAQAAAGPLNTFGSPRSNRSSSSSSSGSSPSSGSYLKQQALANLKSLSRSRTRSAPSSSAEAALAVGVAPQEPTAAAGAGVQEGQDTMEELLDTQQQQQQQATLRGGTSTSQSVRARVRDLETTAAAQAPGESCHQQQAKQEQQQRQQQKQQVQPGQHSQQQQHAEQESCSTSAQPARSRSQQQLLPSEQLQLQQQTPVQEQHMQQQPSRQAAMQSSSSFNNIGPGEHLSIPTAASQQHQQQHPPAVSRQRSFSYLDAIHHGAGRQQQQQPQVQQARKQQVPQAQLPQQQQHHQQQLHSSNFANAGTTSWRPRIGSSDDVGGSSLCSGPGPGATPIYVPPYKPPAQGTAGTWQPGIKPPSSTGSSEFPLANRTGSYYGCYSSANAAAVPPAALAAAGGLVQSGSGAVPPMQGALSTGSGFSSAPHAGSGSYSGSLTQGASIECQHLAQAQDHQAAATASYPSNNGSSRSSGINSSTLASPAAAFLIGTAVQPSAAEDEGSNCQYQYAGTAAGCCGAGAMSIGAELSEATVEARAAFLNLSLAASSASGSAASSPSSVLGAAAAASRVTTDYAADAGAHAHAGWHDTQGQQLRHDQQQRQAPVTVAAAGATAAPAAAHTHPLMVSAPVAAAETARATASGARAVYNRGSSLHGPVLAVGSGRAAPGTAVDGTDSDVSDMSTSLEASCETSRLCSSSSESEDADDGSGGHDSRHSNSRIVIGSAIAPASAAAVARRRLLGQPGIAASSSISVSTDVERSSSCGSGMELEAPSSSSCSPKKQLLEGQPFHITSISSSSGGSSSSSLRTRHQWPVGCVGLSNLGNTCFMNSILQCLNCLPEFVAALLGPQALRTLLASGAAGSGAGDTAAHVARTSSSGSGSSNSSQGLLLHSSAGTAGLHATAAAAGGGGVQWLPKARVGPALSELFRDIWSCQAAAAAAGSSAQHHRQCVISPRRLLAALSDVDERWGDGCQQDSQEFVISLLQIMQSECNRVTVKPKYRELSRKGDEAQQAAEAAAYARSWNNSLVDDLFGGQLQSTITCSSCRHVSHSFDGFLGDLSVPIPRKQAAVTLQDCLAAFVEQEVLTGEDAFKCEVCKKPCDATKRLQLYAYPQLLVLALKRFNNSGGSSGARSSWGSGFSSLCKTSSPLQLNASQLLDLSPYCNPLGVAAAAAAGRPPPRYRLLAVSEHSGCLGGGHYSALGRSVADGRWFDFNDSSVVLDDPPQGSSTSAYVLFFRLADGGKG